MPPVIDPKTGKPTEPPATPAPDMVQIPATEWNGIKQRLDAFERGGMRFNQPAPAPIPQGPSFVDQIRTIDQQIEGLNTKIDEAVTNNKPVSRLLNERDQLAHKRTRMQIKYEDIDPAMNAGIQTIDQLTDAVTRGSMKHLDLVKDDFDSALNNLTPEQRMNPKMREAAYQIACGKNMDKIMAAQREEILRDAAAAPNNSPPNSNSRSADAQPAGVPQPKDVLSKDSMNAIKSKGISVDQYYQKLGYSNWADFWEKRGKGYFGEQEAA